MKPSELTDEQVRAFLASPEHGLDIEHEDTGPGKFEGTSNPGLAQALYERSLDMSWIDDMDPSEHGGAWFALMGRVTICEDGSGFVDFYVYDSPAHAREVWESNA